MSHLQEQHHREKRYKRRTKSWKRHVDRENRRMDLQTGGAKVTRHVNERIEAPWEGIDRFAEVRDRW